MANARIRLKELTDRGNLAMPVYSFVAGYPAGLQHVPVFRIEVKVVGSGGVLRYHGVSAECSTRKAAEESAATAALANAQPQLPQ